jgi:hypothetical protein
MSDYLTIINAFQPASPLDDPERFAGRRDQVKKIVRALYVKGSVPMVFGQRGLGKSSLAMQIRQIAQGDATLLHELDMGYLELPESKNYVTLYVTCSQATEGVEGLMQLIINAIEGLRFEKESSLESDKLRLVERTTKNAISWKIFSRETEKRYEEDVLEKSSNNLSTSERMAYEAQLLVDITGQPVLVIIDEFDLLEPKERVAEIFKNYSTEYLKFMPVGIASTQAELLQDHQSLGRQLEPVRVPVMKESELEDIVERVEGYLVENGVVIRFTQGASAALAAYSSGFPWFVHVIGQNALSDVFEDEGDRVDTSDIHNSVSSLSTGRMAQQYHDWYQRAVGDSMRREIVLRLLASWPAEDIPTREVYEQAINLGVSGASVYLGHLTHDRNGCVIRRSPNQDRGLYRFNDEMFKAYVRIRPSIFSGADSQVRDIVKRAGRRSFSR